MIRDRSLQEPLPQSIPLQGTDYYHLLFDKISRKSIGRGNVCHLTLTLSGECKPAELTTRLNTLPWVLWLHSLRLERSLLRTHPHWVVKKRCGHLEGAIGQVPPQDINPQRECPLRWTLIFNGKHSELTLSWHHTLLDAHGAELLIRLVGSSDLSLTPEMLLPKPKKKVSLRKSSAPLKSFGHFISTVSREPLASLTSTRKKGNSFIRRIEFDQQATQIIAEHADKLGARMFPSCLLIAATARSVLTVLGQDSLTAGDLLVPIPHDDRRRIGYGPLLSNQLTVLFYRLAANQLGSLETAVSATLDAMQHSIMSGQHREYSIFMDQLRRLPEPFARQLLLKPSKGHMGSFFFSDVGEVLGALNSFLGHTLLKAEHTPPFISPPGLSVVASRFRGTLTVTILSASHFLDESKLTTLGTTLHNELLSCGIK